MYDIEYMVWMTVMGKKAAGSEITTTVAGQANEKKV